VLKALVNAKQPTRNSVQLDFYRSGMGNEYQPLMLMIPMCFVI